MTHLTKTRLTLLLAPLLLLFTVTATAQDFEPVYAKNGMVAGPDKHAVQAGVKILKEGGNAFDAAVAVAFALAVTYPQAGNIGGGGFLVGYTAEGTPLYLDYREEAPGKATPGMYQDEEGYIWNARWGGGCVLRIDPNGKTVNKVDIPALLVTSCIFGGPDLDILYVTTARYGLSDSDLASRPLSGGIFAFKAEVPGRTPNLFYG